MTWLFAPLVRKKYRVLVIDPPWSWAGGKKSRPQHYERMNMEDILAMPVRELLHPDGARVFLWITAPLLNRIGDLQKAWRLKFSTTMTWIKVKPSENMMFFYRDSFSEGMGLEVRGNAEFIVILKIGKPQRLGSKKFPSLIVAPRMQHSRKPVDLHEAIEARLDGPYAEVFARAPRLGWDVWGNETQKFGGEAA